MSRTLCQIESLILRDKMKYYNQSAWKWREETETDFEKAIQSDKGESATNNTQSLDSGLLRVGKWSIACPLCYHFT